MNTKKKDMDTENMLTYPELRAMAVAPNERGAYSNSPLGPTIGLHVHPGDLDVDVVTDMGKIAEVYPDHTVVYTLSDPLVKRLPRPIKEY